MAISFPTPLDTFFAQLPIEECSPDLTEAYEMNETGGGEILTADLGVRLWQMEVSLREGYYNEMERFRTLINLHRQSGRPFFVHAIPAKYPNLDPTGSILGANTPRLYSVAANMRDIVISGLPNGYRLQIGDCLSFQYGTNPVRYAFHQIVNDATAASNGRTGAVEVSPPVRTGYATNAVIQLVRPYFKGVIIPNSTKIGKTGSQRTKGISFSIQQTLRN